MARVYADDIDKLRIPMPASSNWGDPKGRVDPEVLRAASWGTDFDVDARRNSIAQALTSAPQAQAAGPTPAQQYLQAIGWGGTEQQYYDSLGGPAAAIAQRNAILGGGGGGAAAPVASVPQQQVAAPVSASGTSLSGFEGGMNPDLAAFNWGNGSSGGFGFSGFDGDSGYLRGFGGIGFGDAGGGTSGGPGSGGPGS